MKKILLFSACLALVLSATAFAAETVSVKLLLPDGTWLEKAVSCPENASLWYAAYDASGKMPEAGRVPAQDGKAALALSQNAETVKIFALGADFKPLFALTLKGGSLYERGKELLASGDYAGAIAAFTDAIAAGDNAPLSYVGRGDAYIALGEVMENLAAAQADYEAALALEKTLAEAYLGVADVYIRRADYEQAKSVLQDALGKALDTNGIEAKIQEILSGNIQDSSGKTRRRSTYDADGNLLWRFEFAYNPQGQKSSVTSYNRDGVETGHIDFRYRDDGKQLTDYDYFEDIDVGTLEMLRVENEYDISGKLVKESYYSLGGELLNYFISRYDERGFLIRDEQYDSEGTLDYYWVYQNNASGLWTKRENYTADGEMLDYQTMEYTSSGDWRVQCGYNDIGNGNFALTWRRVCEYDDAGKRIRIVYYDGDGNVYMVTEYD